MPESHENSPIPHVWPDPAAGLVEKVVEHLRRTLERDGGRHPASVVREFAVHVNRVASEAPLDFDRLLERCIEILNESDAPQEVCIEICMTAEAARNASLHREVGPHADAPASETPDTEGADGG